MIRLPTSGHLVLAGLALWLGFAPLGWPVWAGETGKATSGDDASSQRALDLYRRALTHYNLSQYDEAIGLFKQAYVLSSAPELLYNIAQAYRLKGQSSCPLALRFYRNYVREDPAAGTRPAVRAVIADMERCVQSLSPPAVASTQRASALGAAPPTVRADRPGWLWPAILLGGAGLVLAGGVAALIWTKVEYDGLVRSTCAPACDSERVDGLRTGQAVGWVLAGTGLAAGATGLLVWLLGHRSHTPTDEGAARPIPIRLGTLPGGATAELRF